MGCSLSFLYSLLSSGSIAIIDKSTDRLIENYHADNLNAYKFKQQGSAYIVCLFAIRYLGKDSKGYEEFINLIDKLVSHETVGLNLKIISDESKAEYSEEVDINNYKTFLFETINYEERLKILEYFFIMKRYVIGKVKYKDELIRIAVYLKCKKIDYISLNHKYKEVD